jgi:hypothetical protein
LNVLGWSVNRIEVGLAALAPPILSLDQSIKYGGLQRNPGLQIRAGLNDHVGVGRAGHVETELRDAKILTAEGTEIRAQIVLRGGASSISRKNN